MTTAIRPIEDMTADEVREEIALEEHLDRLESQRVIMHFKPYAFQEDFMAAGLTHSQRLLMAANRVGKTITGACETSYHLTGEYPDWWKGRRFDHPVKWWAGSDTNETVRDVVQRALLGDPEDPSAFGTGSIPRARIMGTTRKISIPNAYSTILVKHKSGRNSIIALKAYEQGREKWQGEARHGVWLDEEPPEPIYTEAVTRTLDKKGIVYLTFTPLKGLSNVVMRFIDPDTHNKAQSVTTATWDDAPHLDQQARDELWATLPPHERDARSKGIPSLGSGRIYPIAEEVVTVDDMEIPDYWPRAYALDVGWHWTACIWGALDRQSDTIYLYSAYKAAEEKPAIHAAAIRARGDWIPGCIDPAANGRNQKDGTRLMEIYEELGLDLIPANNAVEAGIYEVWNRITTGRLKVFGSLAPWFKEFRFYRRDEKGRVVKKDDHLMDSTRYLTLMIAMISIIALDAYVEYDESTSPTSGRSVVGGY